MYSTVSGRTVAVGMEATSVPIDERVSGILRLIRPDSILGALPQSDLETLLRWSPVRTLPKQHVLFRCGDEGRTAVLVLNGFVKLSTTAANGRELLLEIAGPGTLFGEIAVLGGSSRRADATSLTGCRVLALDGRLFRQLLTRTPEAMFAALRLVTQRLLAMTEREVDSVSLPAPVRLAKTLLYLAALQPPRADGSVHIGFRLSQRELGAMSGLIRESINKHLRAWRAAGWVELSGGRVTLCDVAALEKIVHGREPN